MPIYVEDEADYAEAVRELANGVLREGLWAKTLVEANGDQERAKVLYLKYRVALIKEEKRLAALRHQEEQQEKERQANLDRQHTEEENLKRLLMDFPEAETLGRNELRALGQRHAAGTDVRSEVKRLKNDQLMVWIAIGACALIVLGVIISVAVTADGP